MTGVIDALCLLVNLGHSTVYAFFFMRKCSLILASVGACCSKGGVCPLLLVCESLAAFAQVSQLSGGGRSKKAC